MPLQLPNLLHAAPDHSPHLESLQPRIAIPGGSLQVTGTNLLAPDAARLPEVFVGDIAASFDLVRSTRARVRVPEGAISGDLVLRGPVASNSLHASIGVPMAEELHLVSNPAVDREGNLFAMISGPRGERVPVSVVRIAPDLQRTPFVRDLLNVSALAFDREGNLFASSRAEGTIYRIQPDGQVSTYAEGMGIATGLALDREGSLYVGDRSGTIFKLTPRSSGSADDPALRPEVFVFATLEPSVAFYHLCFRPDGTLLVTAPSTSSSQPIYAISPTGDITTWFSGLGRPQGMALDVDGNVYVAASLHGERGIVRVAPNPTGHLQAELVVAGNDLIGLCFLDEGCAALATHTTLFHTAMGVEGLPLL